MAKGAVTQVGQRYTRAETRLRVALLVIALESIGFAVLYIGLGLAGKSEFPFTVNSTAKDSVFAVLAIVAWGDLRRSGWLTTVLAGAHFVLATMLATMLLTGHVDDVSHTMPNPSWLGSTTSCLIWLGVDVVIAAGLSWMYAAAGRERHRLKYLGPAEFRALAAVSEVLTDREHADEPDAEAVASAVDEYLASFSAQGKWRIRLALFVLGWYPTLFIGRPPLWLMAPGYRQQYLQRLFIDSVAEQRGFGPLREIRQSLIRTAQQMSYLGFYRDETVGRRCGYLPFTQRPEYAEAMKRVTPDRPRLKCLGPADVPGDQLDADVVIIGSGAGGATMAGELAAKGRQVLLLERGRHVDPSEFTEDEPTQFSALYSDGALTLSRDFRFQVLQGMCVGGGTVVNNAVCFNIPKPVLADWVGEKKSGLDPIALDKAFDKVRASLGVSTQSQASGALTPVWKPFVEGVNKLGLTKEPYGYGLVDCNIGDCLGCGYCNIGCAYGKKLSMLDVTLPRAQAAHGEDAVRILAECRVDKIEHRGGVARSLQCTLGDGSTLTVRANEVVVAAGAIASSVLLQRSGIGGRLAGTKLGFNIAAPIVADFEQALHPERGLQISHWLEDPHGGFALETWGQPIVSMSLFMPGWFDEHERNMRRYAHMACVGSVVGSASEATVKPARNKRAVKLDYHPSRTDIAKLTEGLKLGGRVMLAAGARRVMPPSLAFHEYHSPAELERLPADVSQSGTLSVNTAHPQGGNRMSSDAREGVVAPDFRVHGMENVRVCDASVFPTTITVNPQLTVMALAVLAAEQMS